MKNELKKNRQKFPIMIDESKLLGGEGDVHFASLIMYYSCQNDASEKETNMHFTDLLKRI